MDNGAPFAVVLAWGVVDKPLRGNKVGANDFKAFVYNLPLELH